MSTPNDTLDQLESAYKAKPYDTKIILALLELVEEAGDFKRVNELLKRLTELEETPSVRARYYFSIGQVYETKFNDPLDAIEYYDKCIEDDPSLLVAFDHLANLLKSQKKWRKLEREYKKMIKRIEEYAPEDHTKLFKLWRKLGTLFREQIKDDKKADEAFARALEHDPQNLEIRLERASIQKESDNADFQDVLRTHEEILELDPFNQVNMTELFKLHWENQDYDRAWCLSALMKGLGLENKEAERFYGQHIPKGLTKLEKGAIDGLWRYLIVAGHDDYELGQLFAILADIIPVLHGTTPKSLGLQMEQPWTRDSDGPTFNAMFYYVIDVYGFSDPPLYLLPERDEGFALHSVLMDQRVRKIVSVGSHLLSGHLEPDLAFILGRELLYLLPGYNLIKTIPSRSELVTLILGAIKLANPRLGFGVNERTVNKAANQIADLIPPQVIEHLATTIKEISAHGRIPDIDGYIDRARLSSHRIGYLLCQNINTALHHMKQESYGTTGLTFEAAQKELVKFAATRDYFAIRKKTGIAID